MAAEASYDVIVVGGGVGGLAAVIEAARFSGDHGKPQLSASVVPLNCEKPTGA